MIRPTARNLRILCFVAYAASSTIDAQSPSKVVGDVAIEGQVVAAEGTAIPGAQVLVPFIGLATTGQDGRFSVQASAARPGLYEVLASGADFEGKTTFEIPTADNLQIQVRVVVSKISVSSKSSSDPFGPVPNAVGDGGGGGGGGPAVDEVDVFYATNRATKGTSISNLRSTGGALSYGRLRVRIPIGHRRSRIEKPRWYQYSYWFGGGNLTAFAIQVHTPETLSAFHTFVSSKVKSSKTHDVFVFVHGYNVSFQDAAFRTAQLAWDLRFDGPAVMYSWPSNGAFWGYTRDRENAEWSAAHFRSFLNGLKQRSGATRIHIVGHSMGSLIVARALQGFTEGSGEQPKLSQIVLASPDIDSGLFEQLAVAIVKASARVTLYASSKDLAIQGSNIVGGQTRAGDASNIVVVEGVDSIDASVARDDLLGHSSFAQSVTVLDDLFYVIRSGLPPSERAGLRATENSNKKKYWVFAP